MEITLLGPLAARIGHHSVVPSAAKQSQILAVLALNAGRIVSISALVEELWGDCPPRSYLPTLQSYVCHLRQLIDAALDQVGDRSARDIVTTQHDGYLLAAQSCEVDVLRFKQLSKMAHAAFYSGDHAEASMLFAQALMLWRGRALEGLRMGDVLKLEALSLENMRLGVLERRIETELRLGRHTEVLGELVLLVGQNPMHENFCASYMTALYQSGLTTRALIEFQRMRSALVELGLEPSSRLQQLQGAILNGDRFLFPVEELQAR